ncbi:MAG TPA: RNA methyltransferase, partial [Eubacteriaceae bacterium]|nr:RNA methyltransferase [Eubacteriaceae bacterium]
TADRILLQMASFHVETFDELYEETQKIKWEDWIGRKGAFPVAKATSVKSKLFSKSDCQRIVKKSVADRLSRAYGTKWHEESGATVPIHINILKDEATLSLDTSGTGLHKR